MNEHNHNHSGSSGHTHDISELSGKKIFWDIVWIDPIVTIAISLYILREAWHVTKTTIDILMQSSPILDYENIKKEIEDIQDVNNIHHVHAWMINEKTIHFEAHLDLSDMLLSEVQVVYEKIEHLLKEHYGISHITLQAEVDTCCSKNFFTS